MGALADGGVTMRDVGILAAGNLMGGAAPIGQMLQKQIGQTGIPVYNVVQRVRDRRDRAAHRDHGGEGGRGRRRARGRRREARRASGLLAGGSRKSGGDDTWDAEGPLRRGRRRSTVASAPRRCRACSRRSAWSTATVRRRRLRALRQDLREEPRALDAEPARGVPEAVHARRDHERRDDRLPEHAPDVLGQLRRRGGRGRRQRRQAADALARAAAARGQGVGVGAHDRPVRRGVPDPAERQHAHAQRGEAGVRAGRHRSRRPRPRRAARLLRDRRARALRQPRPVRGGRRGRLLPVRAPRGATARRR